MSKFPFFELNFFANKFSDLSWMSFDHCCLLAKRVSSEYDVHIISRLLPSKLYVFANSSRVFSLSSILCNVLNPLRI